MVFNYTEESLTNLKKNQLVELFLHLQSYKTETINKLTGEIQIINGEIQKINETFSKYEADIAITKNANTLLSNKSRKLKDSVGQTPNTLVGNALELWVYLRQRRKKI